MTDQFIESLSGALFTIVIREAECQTIPTLAYLSCLASLPNLRLALGFDECQLTV